MKSKILFASLLMAITSTFNISLTSANETKVLIKNDTKTFTHQIKIPIYKKPTILDMEVCNDKREKCLSTCDDKKNITCKDSCPICPFIRETPFLLKGFNDTDLSLKSSNQTQNFTAVVRMKNIIHNIIDISPQPIVNITNTNYVHIYQNQSKTGGKYGFGYNKDGPCCMEIHPKTCSMSLYGPKCHHKRHRACGEQCTSRVIHKRKVRVCNSGTCQNQVRYIAQPDVPTCTPSTKWPFINCRANSEDCESCFENFDDNDPDAMVPRKCIPCFSQVLNLGGPLYRRGPVLGSPYYDPYYGYYEATNKDSFSQSYNYDTNVSSEDEGGKEGGVSSDFQPSEWRIEARKCKRTYPNGTLEITNCEDVPFENDEFLRNALEITLPENKVAENSRRRRRRTRRVRRVSRKSEVDTL